MQFINKSFINFNLYIELKPVFSWICDYFQVPAFLNDQHPKSHHHIHFCIRRHFNIHKICRSSLFVKLLFSFVPGTFKGLSYCQCCKRGFHSSHLFWLLSVESIKTNLTASLLFSSGGHAQTNPPNMKLIK